MLTSKAKLIENLIIIQCFSLNALITIETLTIIKRFKIIETSIENVKKFLFENFEHENAFI